MEVITINFFNKKTKPDNLNFQYLKEIQPKKNNQKSKTEALLDSILEIALHNRSSDIHIEPLNKTLRIRYRIDGILITLKHINISLHLPLISRIKILCGMDITEKRMPQDGRFKGIFNKKEYDLRIGIIPTYYGEKAVIRILSREYIDKTLEEMGFDKVQYCKFFELLRRKTGMLIFTGPMGSGKTTSMYGVLNELNNENVNITTIEDPIEYSVEGINQVQCHNEIGLTFATILKGLLRQDSDIIMIGEIRDKDTAQIALRASLTGHLVISTLHTNSSGTSIKRLLNLGVEPYIISSGIKGIQNQRLIRKLCPRCLIKDQKAQEKLKLLGLDPDEYKNREFYTHSGCKFCNGTGYIGRIMVGEFLYIDDEIIKEIENNASVKVIEEIGVKNGMIPLIKDGVNKALCKLTSLDEVIREC